MSTFPNERQQMPTLDLASTTTNILLFLNRHHPRRRPTTTAHNARHGHHRPLHTSTTHNERLTRPHIKNNIAMPRHQHNERRRGRCDARTRRQTVMTWHVITVRLVLATQVSKPRPRHSLITVQVPRRCQRRGNQMNDDDICRRSLTTMDPEGRGTITLPTPHHP